MSRLVSTLPLLIVGLAWLAPAAARAQDGPTTKRPASRPAASRPTGSQRAASQPAASQPAAKPPTPKAPTVTHTPSREAVPAGQAVRISAAIRPPAARGAASNAYLSARLLFRPAGESEYAVAVMSRGAGAHRFVGEVPAFAVRSPALQYYIEAFAGRARGSAGSASSPLSLPVRGGGTDATGAGPPESKPWYKRWYVWVAAGLLAAGITATVIVSVSGPDTTTPVPQQ